MDPVEAHPFLLGPELEPEARAACRRRWPCASWRSTSLPASSTNDGDDRLALEADGRDVGPDDDGGRLEVGLADRDLADADVLGDAPRRGHHGIDRRQLRPVDVARVGPVAVGEEQHAGQRQAAEPLARGPRATVASDVPTPSKVRASKPSTARRCESNT